VYGGAHLFNAGTIGKLGTLALYSLDDYAPTSEVLATAMGIEERTTVATLRTRVRDKLEREPVEDYRIDFEDGYGVRSDEEEDRHAGAVASELALGFRERGLSPSIGIRIKPLNEALRERSIKTLDLVLTCLVEASGLPERWIVTLPKVTIVEQVDYFAAVLAALERSLGLAAGTLRFEVMVETPQIILADDGRSLLPRMLDAADGRLVGAHFGPYDYMSSCNIAPAHQRLQHPVCDVARHTMQVALAGTGVWLSDGPTTVLPVPVHRPSAGGPALDARQRAENEASVHYAWRLHFDDVRRSLAAGFPQSWDLHPAQLVSRYAAAYSFFIEGIESAGSRLGTFIAKAAQASLVGNVFDDAATGQGLLNFFLRGLTCGAIAESDVLSATGLTASELRTRSFVEILQRRANRSE
jgi:citrate lyase beta subunit